MNFNINFDEWIVKMIDKLENSPKVRKLIWVALFIGLLYGLSALLYGIGAVKWW